LRGASVTVAAGNVVIGVETAGADAVGAGAGAGEVATVAGAPHAAIASEARTSSDDNDFMSRSLVKSIVEQ
jgi:hypothetical protein